MAPAEQSFDLLGRRRYGLFGRPAARRPEVVAPALEA
jgi:hypothetical protein